MGKERKGATNASTALAEKHESVGYETAEHPARLISQLRVCIEDRFSRGKVTKRRRLRFPRTLIHTYSLCRRIAAEKGGREKGSDKERVRESERIH